MEFFGENKIFSKFLPEGFYKFQYGLFADSVGAKLALSKSEIENYWNQNENEFRWRFEYEGRVSNKLIFYINPAIQFRDNFCHPQVISLSSMSRL